MHALGQQYKIQIGVRGYLPRSHMVPGQSVSLIILNAEYNYSSRFPQSFSDKHSLQFTGSLFLTILITLTGLVVLSH